LPYTVTEHLDVDVSPAVAFDTLTDHDSWPEWMPSSFLPVGPSLGTLRVGLIPRVRINGLPFATPIEVTVVDRPREITWTGGSASLRAVHTFLFAARDNGTRVTSTETWSGWLAWLLMPALRPGAGRVARTQLAGIKKGAMARASKA
jgi:Polyketide cyclase / dehydrase and lipid transport